MFDTIVPIGEMFAGMAILVMGCVLSYIFYRIYNKMCQLFDIQIERSAKYELIESSILNKIGKKHGLNLEKELVKRDMLKDNKNFRKRLENQVFMEMFGKEKEE